MVYEPKPKSREERISELEEQIVASRDILKEAVKKRNEGIACLLTGLAIPTVVCGAIALATGENPYSTNNNYLNTLSILSTTYGALLTLLSARMFYQSCPVVNSTRKDILSLRTKLKTYK